MKKLFYISIIVFLCLSFFIKNVSADLGPKPTANIKVYYQGQKISDASFFAKMLACGTENEANIGLNASDLISQLKTKEYDSVKDCYWYPSRMSWGGDCKNSECFFNYFLPEEFKLAVFIPSLDKVFISNETLRENFDSQFKAELFSDGTAKIIEATSAIQKDKIAFFLKALIITLILEFLVSLNFFLRKKISQKAVAFFALANLITLPIVWFLFPLTELSIFYVVLLSEVFAVLFEALFVYFCCQKGLSFKRSLSVSLSNNIVSLVLGTMLYARL